MGNDKMGEALNYAKFNSGGSIGPYPNHLEENPNSDRIQANETEIAT